MPQVLFQVRIRRLQAFVLAVPWELMLSEPVSFFFFSLRDFMYNFVTAVFKMQHIAECIKHM